MAKVDPNDEQWKDKGGARPVGSCTADFSVLGFEHFEINGKPVVEVRSVCISCKDSSQVGAELRDLFFLHSPGAMSRFVKFAKDGCGRTTPFDPESPTDVAEIVGNRPFRATVKATTETYKGKDGRDKEQVRHECGWTYAAPALERDPGDGQYILGPAEMAAIEAGRKLWEGYIKWRDANPRGAGGSSGSGGSNGGSGNGGGNSGGSSGGGQTGGGGGGSEYDDVPF